MSERLYSSKLARMPTRQAGFTLVELMVVIAITLFVAAGLIGLILNMRTTFTSQDQLAQVQDSERLVVTMITTTVQSAGYFIAYDSTTKTSYTLADALPASLSANPDGTNFTAGQIISGTDGTNGTNGTVNVRYQTASGDGLMNCQGSSNPATSGASTIWVNSFAVNANNELTCAVNGGAAIPLVSNVARMTILYGVDIDSDGSVDTYLNATAISAASLWGNVKTAQFTLSFVNLMNSKPGAIIILPQPWIQTISLMNAIGNI